MTYQCKLFTPVSGKQWEAEILSSVNYLHQLFSHRTARTPLTELRFVISHCWWIFRLEIRKAAVPEGPEMQEEKKKCPHPPRPRFCLLSAKRTHWKTQALHCLVPERDSVFDAIHEVWLAGRGGHCHQDGQLFPLAVKKISPVWVSEIVTTWRREGGREGGKGICLYCATCRIAKACPEGQRVSLLPALIC